jgi:hypothetical protein
MAGIDSPAGVVQGNAIVLIDCTDELLINAMENSMRLLQMGPTGCCRCRWLLDSLLTSTI